MIGETDAKDRERGLAKGLARSPEEAERASRSSDVARGGPRDIAVVRPSGRTAVRTVGNDAYAAAEIGPTLAARYFGVEILVERCAERQPGRIGNRGRSTGEQQAGGKMESGHDTLP